MGFTHSYKRLENLLETFDDYPNGVSSYIEQMELNMSVKNGSSPYTQTYKKLKRYRYLRKQILLDDDVSEDSVCTAADTAWLENFRELVFDAQDPLAIHFRKSRKASGGAAQAKSPRRKKRSKAVRLLIIAAAVLIIAFIIKSVI